jgi:hypothetical protein
MKFTNLKFLFSAVALSFVICLFFATNQVNASQGNGQEACLSEIHRLPSATSYYLKQKRGDEFFKARRYDLAACWYKGSLEQFSKDGFGENIDDQNALTRLRNTFFRKDSLVELKNKILNDKIRMSEIYSKVQKKVNSDPILSKFRSDLPRLKKIPEYGDLVDRVFSENDDPDAVTSNNAQILAECYYKLKEYAKANQWYKLILDYHSGNPPLNRLLIDSGRGHIKAIYVAKERVAELSKIVQAEQHRSDQKAVFRASINNRKEIGDYVCSVNGYWSGYVERVHNNKLQIRVHNVHTELNSATTESDQLIWAKYNEVGLCD